MAVREKPRQAGGPGGTTCPRGGGPGVRALPLPARGPSAASALRGSEPPGPAGRCPAHAAFQKALRGRDPTPRPSLPPGPALPLHPRDAPGPGPCPRCSESSHRGWTAAFIRALVLKLFRSVRVVLLDVF